MCAEGLALPPQPLLNMALCVVLSGQIGFLFGELPLNWVCTLRLVRVPSTNLTSTPCARRAAPSLRIMPLCVVLSGQIGLVFGALPTLGFVRSGS